MQDWLRKRSLELVFEVSEWGGWGMVEVLVEQGRRGPRMAFWMPETIHVLATDPPCRVFL